MKGTERRQEILKLIANSDSPVSGAALAKYFSVSRQVIVQDMALLRAERHDIISTNRGYILNNPLKFTRVIKAYHSDDDLADELNTIVDFGGTAVDVQVRHKVYGHMSAKLNISSRLDVQKFVDDIKSGKSTPLKDITSGYHYHTIAANSEAALDLIEKTLNEKGYLCEKLEQPENK